MEGDEQVKEAYREYQEEQADKSTAKAALTTISSNQLLIVFGAILLAYYLAFVKEAITQTMFLWLLVAAMIFIYIMAFKYAQDNSLIPEHKLKAILFNKLKWKQTHSPSEIPEGDIRIGLQSKLKKIEGKPTKYVFFFKIVKNTGLEIAYTAEMDPYNAYLLGFETREEGFTGREVTDISFIRKKEDIWDEKYFKGK